MSNFMNIRPVGDELFQAGRAGGRTDVRTSGLTDRQTDMTKLIVAFRNFANTPKKQSVNAVKVSNRCWL
jgi:hypothetical protein